jgi:aminoglycoside phosphotransferase family enzyme/predicted kinase
VVPITREAGGTLAIGGTGQPVEWALEMERFDETQTLDRLPGGVDEALADTLGRAVAAAHARTRPVDAEPWIEALGAYIDEHVVAFRQYPDLFPAAGIDTLAQESHATYQRIRPFLRERGRQGFVRRIHGDLHLGNIVLIGGKPVLFDAIEFSDIIATGDVLYDLAFLLMDLTERGMTLAANIVLNRYLAETRHIEDLDALDTLPFFLSIRASIRAKVTAARLERAGEAGRERIGRSARGYFELARRAIAPAAPRFVAVGGLSGTGKTRLSRLLAPALAPMPGAIIVRSDVERKALFGVGETERLPADAYSEDATSRVYAAVADRARRILGAGQSVIVDAVSARPDERETLEKVAKSAGFPLHGLFLTADIATRLARVGSRAHDASDAGEAVARAQESYDVGPLDWTTIDASGTPEETLTRAKAALASA